MVEVGYIYAEVFSEHLTRHGTSLSFAGRASALRCCGSSPCCEDLSLPLSRALVRIVLEGGLWGRPCAKMEAGGAEQ